LVDRSFYYSFLESIDNRNALLRAIIFITLVLLGIMLYVQPVAAFFKLVPLAAGSLGLCVATAMVAVFWFEVFKWWKRKAGATQTITHSLADNRAGHV
jgi:Ca2+-transporting ATPase